MTVPNPPSRWSYAEMSADQSSGSHRRASMKVVAVAALTVIVVVGAVVGLLKAQSPHQVESVASPAKPLLNDQPPSVILNGLQPRSLYPPGYVDFDAAKSTFGPGDIRPEDIDLTATYTTTSDPAGCDDDPVYQASRGDDKDPLRYWRYPLLIIMYPVDDPGGNGDDRGFTVDISPAPNTNDLNDFRKWYTRCANATITLTRSKDGAVIRQDSSVQEQVLVPPPKSNATDSVARTRAGKNDCDYIGLARGMLIEVTCPTSQKEAGAGLFRTVIDRINAI